MQRALFWIVFLGNLENQLYMKKLFLILFLFIYIAGVSQFTQKDYTSVFEKFQTDFNNNHLDKIIASFSPETSTPTAKIKPALETLRSTFGNIESFRFVRFDPDSSAIIKIIFDYSVMGVQLSLDKDNKIKKISIRPFKDFDNSNSGKLLVNNLSSSGKKISEEQLKYVFEYAKSFPNNSQLSIALINEGEPTFYGILKRNDTLHYQENQKAQFEIGSLTKVFTSTILAEKIIENELNLDDNVFDILKMKPSYEISLLSLANHTSGLPRLPSNLDLTTVDQENPYKDYGENELQTYLQGDLSFLQTTPKKYQYSNLGTGLLGYVLTKSSNQSLESLLHKYVFSKYDMTSSTTDKSKALQLVKGRNKKGMITKNWDMGVLAGAGAIISNVDDLSKFVLAQFDRNNITLNKTREKTTKANSTMDVALGWHIRKSNDQKPWFWHNGGTGGYTTSLTFNPVTKNGVIILSNVSAFHPKMSSIDRLNFRLMETLD